MTLGREKHRKVAIFTMIIGGNHGTEDKYY